MNTLKDGISFKDGKLDIDLNKDWYDDVILLRKKRLNNKHYTRMGISVFFGYVLTKPDVFNDEETSFHRNSIRTAIKNYNTLSNEDLNKINILLNESLNIFNTHSPLNLFDTVVSVESTAPLNKYLISQIKPRLKSDAIVVSDLFVKNNIEELDLDWNMLDREKSEETKKQVLDMYEKFLKNKSMFFIKNIRTGFRRYFINFLKFKDNNQKILFDHLFGKNVLLVDDTVGEVATFRDMIRLLSTYKPKEYSCFAFLKDY
jgi:hypothetical protein